MFIRAFSVLGIRAKNGTGPIYPGCVAEVEDKDGLRMIELGAAEEVTASAKIRSNNISAEANPGENPSNGENAQNVPSNAENGNGTIKGNLVKEDLEEMSYTQLKELAKDMGIETGKIKSKAGMIEAICAIDVYADEIETDDAPPAFEPQEVVE